MGFMPMTRPVIPTFQPSNYDGSGACAYDYDSVYVCAYECGGHRLLLLLLLQEVVRQRDSWQERQAVALD